MLRTHAGGRHQRGMNNGWRRGPAYRHFHRSEAKHLSAFPLRPDATKRDPSFVRMTGVRALLHPAGCVGQSTQRAGDPEGHRIGWPQIFNLEPILGEDNV
jgi:hypothetical protein